MGAVGNYVFRIIFHSDQPPIKGMVNDKGHKTAKHKYPCQKEQLFLL